MQNNNTRFLVVAGLLAAILVAGWGWNAFIDRVAARVVQKIGRDYSPSPYGPGFDPDKVRPKS